MLPGYCTILSCPPEVIRQRVGEADVVRNPSTDLPCWIRNASIFRSALNEQLVVLVARLGLSEENREQRVITIQVGVVVRIPTDDNTGRSRGLLELCTAEADRFVVARHLEQLSNRAFVALDDVRQAVHGGIIQHIANHERVNDPTEFVVHQRTDIRGCQGLHSGADVVRGQIRPVCQLDVHGVVYRGSRVGGQLGQGVQSQGESVVQFVREIL